MSIRKLCYNNNTKQKNNYMEILSKTIFEGEDYKFVSELENLETWRAISPMIDALTVFHKTRKTPVLSLNVQGNDLVGIRSLIANNEIMKSVLKDLNSFVKEEKLEVKLDSKSDFKLLKNGTVGFQYGIANFEYIPKTTKKSTNKY